MNVFNTKAVLECSCTCYWKNSVKKPVQCLSRSSGCTSPQPCGGPRSCRRCCRPSGSASTKSATTSKPERFML